MEVSKSVRATSSSNQQTLQLLGTQLDAKLTFVQHHAQVLRDVVGRTAVIRRLRVEISRGPLLKAAAWALVVGKIQGTAWVTRRVRLSDEEIIPSEARELQVAINDLARVLLGVRRAEHVKISDLLDRTGLPSLNEIVVQQSAVSAWKAAKGGALAGLLHGFDTRTRGASSDLVKAVTPSCIASTNMARVWNASSDLRQAQTLTTAKAIAKRMARVHRFN